MAKSMGLPFHRKHVEGVGRFYTLGTIGAERVNAFETDMGPFGRGGSAATAVMAMARTQATGIIQLGMAFGTNPQVQRHGDVLVSSSIVNYDYRLVLDAPGSATGYIADYTESPTFLAKDSLLHRFERAKERASWDFAVHVGTMLSGGSRIRRAAYRDELVRAIPAGDRPIVSGEMEGLGLPIASDEPAWILVKGISDFADGAVGPEFDRTRELACRHSAYFVLRTLLDSTERLQ